MDPLSSIRTYKQAAQEGVKEFNKSGNTKGVKVLSEQIKNLDALEKEIKSAQKVDSAFMKFLKAAFWTVTSPIWILPYLIKKLFVKESSQEERIQHIANKILNHIPKNLAQLHALRSFEGESISTEAEKADIRTLIAGRNFSSKRVPFMGNPTIKVVDAFNKDISRTPNLRIEGKVLIDGVSLGKNKPALKSVYEKFVSFTGEERILPMMNLVHQGLISGAVKNLYFKVLSKLQESVPSLAIAGVDASQYVDIFTDKQGNIHVVYTHFSALKDNELEETKDITKYSGLIGYEEEVIVSKEDLAKFQSGYLAKLEELESQLASHMKTVEENMPGNLSEQEHFMYLKNAETAKYGELKIKLMDNDADLIDPELTTSLQVIDRFSTVYGLSNGLDDAIAKALTELESKRA